MVLPSTFSATGTQSVLEICQGQEFHHCPGCPGKTASYGDPVSALLLPGFSGGCTVDLLWFFSRSKSAEIVFFIVPTIKVPGVPPLDSAHGHVLSTHAFSRMLPLGSLTMCHRTGKHIKTQLDEISLINYVWEGL